MEQLSPERVLSLFLSKGVHHIIQEAGPAYDEELRIAKHMSLNPAQFAQFPASILTGAGEFSEKTEKSCREFTWNFSHPNEKKGLLETVDECMRKITNSWSLIHDARMVTDEIITNAIIHGPFVKMGMCNPEMEQVAQALGSDPKKWPEVFLAQTADRFFIGCRDFHGSLDLEKMLKRVQICFSIGPGDLINFGRGGAQIGSYMVIEACTSFYLAVESGVSTTLIYGFPKRTIALSRRAIPKNLHIIWLKGVP